MHLHDVNGKGGLGDEISAKTIRTPKKLDISSFLSLYDKGRRIFTVKDTTFHTVLIEPFPRYRCICNKLEHQMMVNNVSYLLSLTDRACLDWE